MIKPIATILVTVALGASPALAQQLRRPVACDGCIGNWYYFDHDYDPGTGTAIQDWNCGGSTYDDHRGSDFSLVGGNGAIDAGNPVVATGDGTVIVAHDGEFDHCTACSGTGCGTSSGYGFGNYLKIDQGGRIVIYAHMRRGSLRFGVGDHVTCGAEIGQIGSAGCSTGAHLHVELRPTESGTAYDPFHGACSSAASAWVGQGDYRGLPVAMCSDGSTVTPPPTATCPSGTYAIWTCLADLSARRRCIDGTVETLACSAGCVGHPVGVDDTCAEASAPPPAPTPAPTDADGDGYAASDDCDDSSAARHPGARELCDDGVDSDCDGLDCSSLPGADAGVTLGSDAGTGAPPDSAPAPSARRRSGGSSATLEGGCAVSDPLGTRTATRVPVLALSIMMVLGVATIRRRRSRGRSVRRR